MMDGIKGTTEGSSISAAMKKKNGRLLVVAIATIASLAYCMSAVDSSVGHSDEGTMSLLNSPASNFRRTSAAMPKKPTFLYGIFSTKDEKRRREMIRNTILTSLPEEELCPLHEYVKAMDEGNYPSTCRILYAFVVGNIEGKEGPGEHLPDNDTPVAIDSSMIPNGEPDVVYLNIRENMNEGKSPTWFKYASELVDKYDIDYVSKADSDTFMWMPNLLNFMDRDLPPGPADPSEDDNRRMFGGIMVDQGVCGGESTDYCKKLFGKVYMGGQFYFISSDLTKFLNNPALDRSRPVPHEDYDFGVRVLSNPLPVKLVALAGYRFWQHGRELKTDEGWMDEWNKVSAKGEAPVRWVPKWWPQVSKR